MEKLDEVHRIAGTRNDNVLGSDTDLGSSVRQLVFAAFGLLTQIPG